MITLKTLQVCRLSFHFVCVRAVLDLLISYYIASLSSALRCASSSTKQQHTQQFQLGSERKSQVHLRKFADGLKSTRMLFLNSGMWTVSLVPRNCLQFSLKKIKPGWLVPAASHIHFSLQWPGTPSLHVTGRDGAMVTMSTWAHGVPGAVGKERL